MGFFTFYDAVESAYDFLGTNTVQAPAEARDAKRAVAESLRNIVNAHDWVYFLQEHRIELQAPYSTGTITYVASTRVATISGGTWPTWAASGSLLISDVWYNVETRTSGTEVILSSTAAPVDDISTATAFTLYQDEYELPSDFLVTKQAYLSQYRWLQYMTAAEWIKDKSIALQQGEPVAYAIFGSSGGDGRLAMRFFPYPPSAMTAFHIYKRTPRELMVYKESDGTVSTTAASTTITGTNTAWTSALVGSIIRIGTSAALPSSVLGESPYVYEGKVTAVSSETSLTVETAPADSLSGRKYIISDPIDVEPHAMRTLVERSVQLALARNRKMDPDKVLGPLRAEYDAAMMMAKNADSRSRHTRISGLSSPIGRASGRGDYRVTG